MFFCFDVWIYNQFIMKDQLLCLNLYEQCVGINITVCQSDSYPVSVNY